MAQGFKRLSLSWWGKLVDMMVARKKRKGKVGAQLPPYTAYVCIGVTVPGEWCSPYSEKSFPSVNPF